MRNFKYVLSIGLMIGFFTGCVEGLIKTGLEIEGRVVKGAINGATVTAYDKDGKILGSATTDASGYYEIKEDIFYKDIVTVSSTGGEYFDEASNTNIVARDFNLTAISTIDENHENIINLTPFTTIAHNKLITSGNNTSISTIDAVNKQVAKIYTGSSFDITKITPNVVNDVSDDGLSGDDEKRYGLLLSAFSRTTAGSTFNVAPKIAEYTTGTLLDEDGIATTIATELEVAITDAIVAKDSTVQEVAVMYQAIQAAKKSKVPTFATPAVYNTKYNTAVNWTPQYTGAVITRCEIVPAIGYGLAFNTSSCNITGTTNDVNTTDYNITAYNAEGNGSMILTLNVAKADRKGFSIGSGYSKADGSPDFNVTATLFGTVLVPTDEGLEYNTSHPAIVDIGRLTGTADVKSSGTATIMATYPATNFYTIATATCDVVVADLAPEINGSIRVINAIYDTPTANWTPLHSGGTPTENFTIAPTASNLPGGFSFDAPSGVISASAGPTVAGNLGTFDQFIITARNAQGIGSTKVDFNISKGTLTGFTMGTHRAMTKAASDYDSKAAGESGGGTVEYRSSNTTVANINITTGIVTIEDVAGNTTITAYHLGDTNYFDANTSYTLTISDEKPNIAASHDVNATYDTVINPIWQIGNTGGGATTCVLTQDIKGRFNLDFNATNCQISGEPNATTLGFPLNITASNAAPGDSSAVISLVIHKADQTLFTAGGPLNVELSDTTQSQTASGGQTAPAPTYTSGNTSIAVVHASTGAITPQKAGVTYIKAFKQGDTNYNDTDANYTLTITDSTAPTIDYVNSTPAHNSPAVSTLDDIVIKFNENISYVANKDITITKVGGGAFSKVFNTAGNITISGDTATLHMRGSVLPSLSQFFITIENGAFKDDHNNLSTNTGGLGTWDFNTTTDATPPEILYDSSTPVNLATNINVTSNIVIKFNENILYNNPKNVTITDRNSTWTKVFSGGNITTATDEATLNISTDRLPYGHELYITVDTSAFKDTNDNNTTDTGGNGVWNFTTQQGDCAAPCIDNCDLGI